MEYTLRRVVHTAKEAGSARSCAARDGSTRWINPRVAVLTGVEAPTAPPPARGGGMKKTSCCWVCILAAGGRISFWFSSILFLDLSECVLRSITELEVARHALDLSCAVWLFWPHGARGLCQRGCYSYLSGSTSVVTISFAHPVYVPVSERGWTRVRA